MSLCHRMWARHTRDLRSRAPKGLGHRSPGHCYRRRTHSYSSTFGAHSRHTDLKEVDTAELATERLLHPEALHPAQTRVQLPPEARPHFGRQPGLLARGQGRH